jgi:hypothetical protein
MEGYDGQTRTVISPSRASSFPHINHFTRVGHSLFIVMFALFGGWFGTVLYRTRDAKEKPRLSPGAHDTFMQRALVRADLQATDN